jgi:hypothetical protein
MHITSRKGLLALVVLASGVLVAACGSSGGSGTTTGTTATTASASAAGAGGPNSARRAGLIACLKQHGVTLPARPPGSGGPGSGAPGSGGSGGTGGAGGTGTGTTPRRGFFFGGGGPAANPKLRAAFQACGAKFGFGAGGRFRARLSHTVIAKYVACVRQHGYNLPNPNFSGKGPVFPANIRSNAKFQAASRACQNLLVPPRGSAPPGGTSTTTGA